jgi:hypothetical protein
MRRKRCSTEKDCASDGGAATSQKGAENCAAVTVLHTSHIASSATPHQHGDLRSLLSKQQRVDKKLLRSNARSRQNGEPSQAGTHPPSSPAACFVTQAPPRQCARGFLLARPVPRTLPRYAYILFSVTPYCDQTFSAIDLNWLIPSDLRSLRDFEPGSSNRCRTSSRGACQISIASKVVRSRSTSKTESNSPLHRIDETRPRYGCDRTTARPFI